MISEWTWNLDKILTRFLDLDIIWIMDDINLLKSTGGFIT